MDAEIQTVWIPGLSLRSALERRETALLKRWAERTKAMLSPDQICAASALLFDLWQDGRRTAQLPAELRPATRAEGYAIQAHLEARSTSPLFGWKIAATSVAGQKHINVDGPLAGRLLAERVVDNGAAVAIGANHMRVAEVEFVFRMGRDLPPRPTAYAVDEVLAAVAALHPAIELPDSRFEDFTAVGAPQLIADNACGHQFVLGPQTTVDWRGMDLAEHAVAGRVGGRYERHGKGANVLGDPRVALTWLANELSQVGVTLKAGQVVTTGTCVVPLEFLPGDEVIGSLGPLGQVSVRLL
jgi:2-keto-4-pentenoate hydratase